jgi:hypothetical protein
LRRFIGTALALGLVAAITWQVSEAQTADDPVVVCTRPGADVRSPDTQGRCASGYTKKTIDSGPVFERNVGTSLTLSFALEAIQEQGDELDLQITVAAPDGETRSQILENVSAYGTFGSFTFSDPVIGGYDLGVRVIGPLARDGDSVPFRLFAQRPEEGFLTILDDFTIQLAFTGGDIVETIPYVYTREPIIRPPA